jgi:hypothetical protein
MQTSNDIQTRNFSPDMNHNPYRFTHSISFHCYKGFVFGKLHEPTLTLSPLSFE